MSRRERRCLACGSPLTKGERRFCSFCRKELRTESSLLSLIGFCTLAVAVAATLFAVFAVTINRVAVEHDLPEKAAVFTNKPKTHRPYLVSVMEEKREHPEFSIDLYPCPLPVGVGKTRPFMLTPIGKGSFKRADNTPSVEEVPKPPKAPKAERRPKVAVSKRSIEQEKERRHKKVDRLVKGEETKPRVGGVVSYNKALVQMLVDMQRGDGTWSSGFRLREYDMGATALAVAALLYAGYSKDSDTVKSAFAALSNWRPKLTYTASCALLMVEAFCADRKLMGKALRQEMRRRFKCAPVWMQRLARASVSVLLRSQSSSGFWSYGPLGMGHNQTDMSNTQFGAFGLYSALNLGIGVPRDAFRRLLSALYSAQQKRGAVLRDGFDVPLARLKPSQLLALEEEQICRAVRPSKETTKVRTSAISETSPSAARTDPAAARALLRTAVDKQGADRGVPPMLARGFAYTHRHRPTVSMTAAGLACLVICKAVLNINSKSINRAIRDAAAWLAINLQEERIATAITHKGVRYSGEGYARYSLCRAAVLSGVARFGDVDWREVVAGLAYGSAPEVAFSLLAATHSVLAVVGGVGGF